jgi:hypothetical protein
MSGWPKSNPQCSCGPEPRGVDPSLAAVGLAGADLALQAGGQELLMLQDSARARSAKSRHRLAHCGCLQYRGQERQFGGDISGRGPRDHNATLPPAPSAVP